MGALNIRECNGILKCQGFEDIIEKLQNQVYFVLQVIMQNF